MRITQLIEALQAAHKEFGDVPVKLIDDESGRYVPVYQAIKLHPFTAPHGCMNRKEPVNAIAITRSMGNSPDLVLATHKP